MTLLHSQPPDTLVTVLVVLAIVFFAAKGHLRDSNPGEDTVETAREAYVNGDIPLSEFERRAALALDEDAQQIRNTVEQVNGIGPDTSAAIAAEFDSLEELRTASTERLEGVAGVGEKRAEDVLSYVRLH